MNQYELTAHVVRTLVLLCALSVFARPARADDSSSVPSPESTALDSGAFQLEYKYWHPKGRGEPKGLLVKYSWGTQGQRTLTATLDKHSSSSEDNWRWVLRFPDQPRSDEVARLNLYWQFELTEAQKKELHTAVRKLVTEIVALAEKTAQPDAAAYAKAFEEQSTSIMQSDYANGLRRTGDSEGNDGLALVRKKLNLEVGDAGGWKLTQEARERLASLSGKLVGTSAQAQDKEAATIRRFTIQMAGAAITDDEKDCKAKIGDPEKLSPDQASSAIGPCALALAKDLEAKDPKSELAASLRKALAARKSDQDQLAFTLADAARDAGATYAYSAAQLATHVAAASATRANWEAEQAKLVDEISADIELTSRSEPGSILIEGGTQPRRYDIATGAIYVAGIQDVIVPMLISVCGWDGCLKQNEVAWGAPHGFARAFSLDAGVRVKTIDTQDPRQSDKLSFALGLSFNPVTVLRVSGGLYAFEDAQTTHWNAQPYAGVTVNVLNAAELLGGLGLGSQLEPKTIAKQ